MMTCIFKFINFTNCPAYLKGQMNQKFDIFYFSSILVKYEPNKHTMKFQLN